VPAGVRITRRAIRRGAAVVGDGGDQCSNVGGLRRTTRAAVPVFLRRPDPCAAARNRESPHV